MLTNNLGDVSYATHQDINSQTRGMISLKSGCVMSKFFKIHKTQKFNRRRNNWPKQ